MFAGIPQGQSTGFPVTAGFTACKHSDGMDKLMSRIRFPVRRLASTGNHDTRTEPLVSFCFHGCAQMHEEGNRAQDPICVIDEPDQLSAVSFPAKINYSLKFGMKVASSTNLDE